MGRGRARAIIHFADPGAAFRGNYTQRDVMQEVRKRLRKYPDLRISVRNPRTSIWTPSGIERMKSSTCRAVGTSIFWPSTTSEKVRGDGLMPFMPGVFSLSFQSFIVPKEFKLFRANLSQAS